MLLSYKLHISYKNSAKKYYRGCFLIKDEKKKKKNPNTCYLLCKSPCSACKDLHFCWIPTIWVHNFYIFDTHTHKNKKCWGSYCWLVTWLANSFTKLKAGKKNKKTIVAMLFFFFLIHLHEWCSCNKNSKGTSLYVLMFSMRISKSEVQSKL